MNSHLPYLSIVTPTLGNYSEQWLDALLRTNGDVECVLVYPPDKSPRGIDDPRVREIVAPHRSGTLQRYVGLLNARGFATICIDDDDYMHPDLVIAAEQYFARFPESWLLRLHKQSIPEEDRAAFVAPWEPLPNLSSLDVADNNQADRLKVVPIAPLTNHFKLRYLVRPYKKTGAFMENFNNTVWRTDIVRQALPDIADIMTLWGHLKLIPNSGCERFFGLFVQAHAYEPDRVIGHLLPHSKPIRFNQVNFVFKKPRFHTFIDLLLLRSFPHYDYFWSRASAQIIYGTPRTMLKALRWKVAPPKRPPLPSEELQTSEVRS